MADRPAIGGTADSTAASGPTPADVATAKQQVRGPGPAPDDPLAPQAIGAANLASPPQGHLDRRSHRGSASTDRDGSDHGAGRWVVTESGGRLLSIGRSLYQGQTPRSQLKPLARRFLLPLITEASQKKETATRTYIDAGRIYQAYAFPVVGPSGELHAVMSYFVEAGGQPDVQPEVGAWEWDVPKLRTYWTRDLFSVYGFPEPPEGRTSWDVPEWLKLSETGGFAAWMEVRSRFQTGKVDDLQLHVFRVQRPDTGGTQRLRMSGRTFYESGVAKARWFRGVTMRVDGYLVEVERQDGHQQYLDAALGLNPWPVFVIDLDTTQIMLNNKQWDAVGLEMPRDGLLTSAVHPDDRAALTGFLLGAASAAEPAVAKVRMACGPKWIPVLLAAVRLSVEYGGLALDQVMIRVEPVPSAA